MKKVLILVRIEQNWYYYISSEWVGGSWLIQKCSAVSLAEIFDNFSKAKPHLQRLDEENIQWKLKFLKDTVSSEGQPGLF